MGSTMACDMAAFRGETKERARQGAEAAPARPHRSILTGWGREVNKRPPPPVGDRGLNGIIAAASRDWPPDYPLRPLRAAAITRPKAVVTKQSSIGSQ